MSEPTVRLKLVPRDTPPADLAREEQWGAAQVHNGRAPWAANPEYAAAWLAAGVREVGSHTDHRVT